MAATLLRSSGTGFAGSIGMGYFAICLLTALFIGGSGLLEPKLCIPLFFAAWIPVDLLRSWLPDLWMIHTLAAGLSLFLTLLAYLIWV